MIEHLMMWDVYLDHLLSNKLNLGVLLLSLILSLAFYFMFYRSEQIRLKIHFLILHVFFIFFPFVYTALMWKCVMPTIMCTPKMMIFLIAIGAVFSILLSYFILPYVYDWSINKNMIKKGYYKDFVSRTSKSIKVKEPKIYLINDIKPYAYSITNLNPSIFVSVGLFELLTKKETEAVLLHELYHHKSRTYFWKFSINMLRMFTPLATFISDAEPTEKEERMADMFAEEMQKTNKYLSSAKKKIVEFSSHINSI